MSTKIMQALCPHRANAMQAPSKSCASSEQKQCKLRANAEQASCFASSNARNNNIIIIIYLYWSALYAIYALYIDREGVCVYTYTHCYIYYNYYNYILCEHCSMQSMMLAQHLLCICSVRALLLLDACFAFARSLHCFCSVLAQNL